MSRNIIYPALLTIFGLLASSAHAAEPADDTSDDDIVFPPAENDATPDPDSAVTPGGIVGLPIGGYGVRYSVLPAGMFVYDAQKRPDGAYLPFSSSPRMGCKVVSAPFFVRHDPGPGTFIPELHLDWTGHINDGGSTDILSLIMEIGRGGQSIRYIVKLTTDHLAKPLQKFVDTDGGMIYRGVLDNTLASPKVVAAYSLKKNDSVKVTLCDLMAGELLVKSMVFESHE